MRVRARAAELRPGLEESLARVRARAEELRPSFEEVVRRTIAMSTKVAARIVGDAESVADVLQDAYLNVYRSLGRFRGASRYETWVYRIVVNAARSHLRRRRRQRSREQPLEPVHLASESDARGVPAVDAVVTQADVVALLGKLSPADREILTLRYLAGLSVTQVAVEVGASEAAVKVRLHRARRRLLALAAQSEELVAGAARHSNW